MTIEEILGRYIKAKPTLSASWIRQLGIAVRLLDRYTGVTEFERFDLDRLDEFRNRLLVFRRSPRTVNGRVSALLGLWRFARKRGWTDAEPLEIDRLPVARRIPRAWNAAEMSRLLAACETAPRRRTWGPEHWRALVLVIYDTSLRVGCLLAVPRSVVEGDLIRIPAEFQKGRVETVQRLHGDTLTALGKLRRNRRNLFDWPYHENEIWRRFRGDIIEPAGLPATRRDLFHKLRRTSYTLVYGALGPQAATQHAAHGSDLSRTYLDPTLINRPDAVAVIPRPGGVPPAPPETEPPRLRLFG